MDNFNKTDDLYDPNFSIDSKSTEKLDMYGVWLKKKKDTIEPLDSDNSQSASDSGIETDQDSINFDDDFSFADSFSGMDTDTEISELGELNASDTSSEIPLETPAPSDSDGDSPDVALDEDGFESLDLDDFLSDDSPVEEKPQEAADESIETEPIDLDFTEIKDDAVKPSDDDEPPAGLENFSEISLEDFEDEAPAEPSESDDGFETVDDFDDILTDDTAEEQKSEYSKQKEDTALDLNVTADDEGTKVQSPSELSSPVVEEDNADILIFGTDDDDTAEDVDSDTEEPVFFDDIEAVKQDLLSTQHTDEQKDKEAESAPEKDTKDTKETMDTITATSQQSTPEQDKATELLMQIAHEISDLKAELNSLKLGMDAHTKAISEAAVKDSGDHQEEKIADTESSGFFSDDDTDETIALTGDELNNILITADFTEEQNSEEGERTAADEGSAAAPAENYEVPPVLTKDIDPDMEGTPAEKQTFEDSIAEISSADTDSAHKSETEGEKLLASDPVFNVEAAPITSLPEDLSYLDDQSDVAAEDAELVEEASSDQQDVAELEEIEEAEPADDKTDFEDINVESFDIPSEQEIEVPSPDTESSEEEIQLDAEATENRTIHELQNDDDFQNPFADESTISESEIKEEIIEEPFIAEAPASESNIEEPKQETLLQAASKKRETTVSIPLELKNEIKSVLSYMDQLLEALPEKKIEEFAKSEYFETYKHLFEELGIS